MILSPAAWALVIALPVVSGYFFFLGRDLTLWRRLCSSAHGLLALGILPVAVFFDAPLAQRGFVLPGLGMLLLAVLVLGSIAYSVIVLRSDRAAHLLHLITLFAAGMLSVLGAFAVGGT